VAAVRVDLPDFAAEAGKRAIVEIDDSAAEVRDQSRGASVSITRRTGRY